jgi:hypothetical protein
MLEQKLDALTAADDAAMLNRPRAAPAVKRLMRRRGDGAGGFDRGGVGDARD